MGYVQITLDGKRPITHVKEHLAKALCDVIDGYIKEGDVNKIYRAMLRSLLQKHFPVKHFESENTIIKIEYNGHTIAFYPKGFPKGSKYYLVIDETVYELKTEAEILEIKTMFAMFVNQFNELYDAYFEYAQQYNLAVCYKDPDKYRLILINETMKMFQKIWEIAKEGLMEYAKD